MKDLMLDENYRLNSDRCNIILQERKVITNKKSKNLGKEYWESIGFYATPLMAIDDLLTKQIRLSKAKSINGLRNDIKKLYAFVRLLEINIKKDNKEEE